MENDNRNPFKGVSRCPVAEHTLRSGWLVFTTVSNHSSVSSSAGEPPGWGLTQVSAWVLPAAVKLLQPAF